MYPYIPEGRSKHRCSAIYDPDSDHTIMSLIISSAGGLPSEVSIENYKRMGVSSCHIYTENATWPITGFPIP